VIRRNLGLSSALLESDDARGPQGEEGDILSITLKCLTHHPKTSGLLYGIR
jgi:hypothetical protein